MIPNEHDLPHAPRAQQLRGLVAAPWLDRELDASAVPSTCGRTVVRAADAGGVNAVPPRCEMSSVASTPETGAGAMWVGARPGAYRVALSFMGKGPPAPFGTGERLDANESAETASRYSDCLELDE